MLDYFRGPDSTGLAAIQGNDAVIAKIASHPVNLFDMKKFSIDALQGYKSRAFIGHNRSATKGKVNDLNAHPYQYGHIVGAHNGTLTEKSWKDLMAVTGEETGTDSAAIFAAIAKVGIEETVKLLQGAWALVWFNLEDNTLNFLRNKERPFWYSYNKEFNRVFWASEHWMMRAAVSAADANQGYELFVDDKGFSFYATRENWHYRYELPSLIAGSNTIPKPRVKELLGKEPAPAQVSNTHFPVQQGGHSHSHGHTHGTGTSGASSWKTGTTSTTTSKASPPKKLLCKIEGTLNNPYGGYISEDDFSVLGKYGCALCTEDVEFWDEGLIIYEKEGIVVCADCSGKSETRIYADPLRMDKFIDDTKNAEIIKAA